ncbi:MAG: hypothetical protein WAO52_06375 [Prolixibacteraceae bacterium]
MNIQAEKLDLMRMILEINEPEVLEKVKNLLLKESKNENWDSLRTEQMDNILWGIDDIENDDTEDFDEFIKKYGK